MTQTRLATMPRVNLLPPEIAERHRFRRVQMGLIGTAVAALLAVAGLYILAAGQVGDAQSDLDTQTETGQRLQREVNTFAQVPAVRAQVDAAEARLTQAMGQEVRWSYFLNDLSLTLPRGVWITKVNANQVVAGTPAAAAAAPTGTQQPILTPGIGSVEFTGRALGHNDVAAFLDALAKQKGYASPYFTNAAFDDQATLAKPVVRFTSTTAVTEAALSNRYTAKAGR
jgi:Tfp pilus assembly protein PilN